MSVPGYGLVGSVAQAEVDFFHPLFLERPSVIQSAFAKMPSLWDYWGG